MTTIASIRVTIGGLSDAPIEQLADVLSDALEENPAALSPLLTCDLVEGTLSISFDYEATGDAREDIIKAMDILSQATDAASVAAPDSAGFELLHGHPLELAYA